MLTNPSHAYNASQNMYRLAVIPCALRAATVSSVPVVRPAVAGPSLAPSMTQTLLRASFSTSQPTPPRHRPTSEKPTPGVPHSEDVERAMARSAEDSTGTWLRRCQYILSQSRPSPPRCIHTTAPACHTTEGMSAKDTQDTTPLGSPQLKRQLEELLARDAEKKQKK